MGSNKKSYAMRMLQLALALSLLHVDPDDILQMRLRDWDSQLELREGDGWELEMLRAVPMVEYPYANRKSMMPFIEDSLLFDRHLRNNQYNITAYLLNVHVDSANQTAALQELQATPSPGVGGTTSSSATSSNSVSLEQSHNATNTGSSVSNVDATTLGVAFPEIDDFLNSDSFQDQRSIWEQNLADLQDFGDLPVPSPYANLPLKDERSASAVDTNNFLDVNLEAFLPSLTQAAAANENANTNNAYVEGACALNDTFPDPDDLATIKVEQRDDDEDSVFLKDAASGLNAVTEVNVSIIKSENLENEDLESLAIDEKPEVDLSPFMSQLELPKEESEIVEVLWKQDVDLGFSLNPPQANLSEASGSSSGNAKALQQPTADNTDDIEKLKALEALKLDKPNFDEKDGEGNGNGNDSTDDNLTDEWAGIPFVIDHETGEHIRLPLDDILDDVLRFAELGNTSEIDTNSTASTSKSKDNAENNENLVKKRDKESTSDYSILDVASKPKGSRNNKNKNNNSKEDDLNVLSTNKIDIEETNDNKDIDKENEDTDDFLGLDTDDLEDSSLPSPLFDLDDEAKAELAVFDRMLQSPGPVPFHHHHHPHAHHHHPGATPHRSSAGVQNYAVGSGANSAFHRQAAAAAGFHHGHHHHQGRMPLSRGVSMEQRLQDIASLFNPIPSMGVVGGDMPPYPHYPTHHYSYQGAGTPQHAQYPPPPPPHHHPHAMLHPNASLGDICSTQPHYGHNLGSAVSSSMHLTNATSHDVAAADAAAAAAAAAAAGNVGAYKMEHDMMYYSNASSDMNHTTDGFINSILNDEDLHLMDMNVNDTFCRLVDANNSTSNNSSVLGTLSSGHGSGGATSSLSMSGAIGGAGATAGGMTSELMGATGQTGTNVASGTDRLDASSDSAVSSMGSERVPSLSDGEWGEGSDSAQDYHQGKYAGGPYDYSYNNNNRLNDGTRQPPVAQKKHQMFGKRYLQDQPGNVVNADNITNGGTGVLPNGPAAAIKYEYEPTYPGMQQNGTLLGEGAIGGALPPPLSKEQQAYDLKYGHGAVGSGAYSLDFSLRTPRTPHEIVTHNHTYTLPQGTGSLPRPQQRDKKLSSSSSSSSSSSMVGMKSSKSNSSRNSEDEHLTRDEKRARALNIPITVYDIINLPMDEFNERLSKYDLSETQLSLIRDIRRRGKNKVAAQNCRKRKLDQILSLEDEVKEVRRRKDQLQSEQASLEAERKMITKKFADLHRHVFQHLRDADGNPCNPSEYSLQQASDGSVFLLPRDAKVNGTAPGVPGIPGHGSAGLNTQQQNHAQHMSLHLPPHHHQQQQQQQQQLQHVGQHQQPLQQQQQHQQQQHHLHHQPPTHHSQTHTKD